MYQNFCNFSRGKQATAIFAFLLKRQLYSDPNFILIRINFEKNSKFCSRNSYLNDLLFDHI